ncbi:DUF7778 domain-containing protein [Caenorhabditis elegans]|uniref:PH domain-containing protein n=1 Tax=Caenorhabditis elegans TaxID=6239 RepID=Q9NAB6_CAEEL|nr:PH domain-containing protein [Caenorhabditis elegans]CAB61098.2 PH domain-containing protein [Caenorhabditis elegans]|eukprot:NP_497110.2 Uncharacterized protein CELE_Y53F4B.24 [Caenorhabditis elegans]
MQGMSSEIMSESLCLDQLETSKSVTKVQPLPGVGLWDDSNALLKDYINTFFTKRSTIFRVKQPMLSRKRVIVLTPDDILLVYETNCTGYSFNVHDALRMKTSCFGFSRADINKTYTITLKYKFGYVNLVLVNEQISVWRRTLSTIYESGQFDQILYNDLTLYTAKDEETDETLVSNRSDFEYTNDAISLKSAHGYLNLSPSEPDATLDRTQTEENCSMNINSNRSSTCIAPTIRSTISRASVISLRQNLLESHQAHAQNAPALPQAPPPNSIRQGALRVAYLAKKFECKKSGKKSENSEKIRSPPLEVLFPPLPVQQLQEEDLKSLKSLKSPRLSKLDFTPSKKSMKVSMKNMELDS